MNNKIRLIFGKIKKVIFENISISVVFFLSIFLIIFFSRPPIDDDKKIHKTLEEDTKFEESDYLENAEPSETIPSLQEEVKNLEKKQVNELKRPVPKNKPAPPKKSVKTENKKSINSTPSETIDLLHNSLKKIVSSNINNKKVQSVIGNTYNIERMLALIIGEVWKKSISKDIKL